MAYDPTSIPIIVRFQSKVLLILNHPLWKLSFVVTGLVLMGIVLADQGLVLLYQVHYKVEFGACFV